MPEADSPLANLRLGSGQATLSGAGTNYDTCLRAARRQVKYRICLCATRRQVGKALFGEDETEAEDE
jgi:hypothetical protein